jgi:hypothetical protein
MKVRIALLIALLGWALPASAQAVKLEFINGRVNLTAQNAPLRTILAEWTRLGGTKIVNGERLGGPPVTLELVGVTEQQAVDVLLRGAAGYIAGPRAAGSTAASNFASILILPTSVAPRQTSASFVQTPPRSARVQPRDPDPDPDPEDDPVTDTAPDADDRPPVTARQAAEEAARRRAANRPQIFIGDRVIEDPAADGGAQTPNQPATSGNPFGIVPGAVRPGVITAPPPQSPETRRRQPDPEP